MNTNETKSGQPTLGIVCSQFPEAHETFVLREMRALLKSGIRMRIYSLKSNRDLVVHAESNELNEIITYVVWNDWRHWLPALAALVRDPVRSWRGLFKVIGHNDYSFVETLKGIAAWALSFVVADKMKQDGVTHIHAHWATKPTTTAMFAAERLGIHFSFTAHAWDIFVRNDSLADKMREAKFIFTCTEYNQRYLKSHFPKYADKIFINYHGVSLETFGASQEKGASIFSEVPLLLSVGRLVPTKGFEDLLLAYRDLKLSGEIFRALIVGKGPLKEKLLGLIRDYGLEKHVEIKSIMSQKDLRNWYAMSFAFILPSVIAPNGDRDGIPNVILEAMAMKLPVISTNISGIPEAVADGEAGYLVAPHDIYKLVLAIQKLLADPDLARDLGRTGRRLVEKKFDDRFHLAHMVATMKTLAGMNAQRAGEPEIRRTGENHKKESSNSSCCIDDNTI